MARFFIWSHEGNGLCIARRLQQQGYQVRFYCSLPNSENGLVDVVRNPTPEKSEVVLFDDIGGVRLGQLFRRQGFPTVGGHLLEEWETKREVGTAIMQANGLLTPETYLFTTIPEAKKFLDREGGYWYFKPDGRDIPKHLTYGEEADFLIRWLSYAEPRLAGVPRFQLQKRIEGHEVDCCLWLNSQGVVAAEATVEEKKFGAGDTGPSTGCQSNLVWSIPTDSPLVERTVGHFVGPLMEAGYVGLAALNCIITDEGDIYGIEFTMRFGYDATQASMLLWGNTFGEQLDAFARGNLWEFDRLENQYAVTLRLSTLPQPVVHLRGEEFEGIPVDEKLLDDPRFFPDAIKLQKGHPVVVGNEGYVGVLGTTGYDISLMRESLVARAQEFKIPYKQYRIDPVSRAESAIDFLDRMGLAPRLLGPAPAVPDRAVRPALPIRGGYPPVQRDIAADGGTFEGSTSHRTDSGDAPRIT